MCKLNFNKFITVITIMTLILVGCPLGALADSNDPAASLADGKRFYSEGKYEDAMDCFVDVFVNGNGAQIAEANEYVNLIHLDRGGVTPPKQVEYNPDLEKKRSLESGHKGKDLQNKKPTTKADKTRLEKAPLEYKEVPVTANNAKNNQSDEAKQKELAEEVPANDAKNNQDASVEDTTGYPNNVEFQSTFPEGDEETVRAVRIEQIDRHINSLTKQVLDKLTSYDNVNVYMRGGMVDAIDIPSNLLFKDDKVNFKDSGKAILEDVYSLMILSGTPSFVILPPGSYSDDVNIQGVRQAVALNSFLINRGISPAKLTMNMGLTTEEPPTKFADLEGLSIVFDYTASPRLKTKLSDEDILPVLSLGLYPFKEINPYMDEGFVVDFSVIEGSIPIKDWKLQIIQHASNGQYYIIRQLSGTKPVYQQIYWNGRKQFFGPILPAGKYTILIIAEDVEGGQKIVRRQVILKEDPNEEKDSLFIRTEAPKVKENKPNKSGVLDYTSPRLWTKPERLLPDQVDNSTMQQENPMDTQVEDLLSNQAEYPNVAQNQNVPTQEQQPEQQVQNNGNNSEPYAQPMDDSNVDNKNNDNNPYAEPNNQGTEEYDF